jgi:hypothetical protein
MKTIIKNKNGESSLTISGDFYQVQDENFTSIFNAISNEITILQELKHVFDKDKKARNDRRLLTRRNGQSHNGRAR